jgi:hypothetical protein
MKTQYIIVFLLLTGTLLYAQTPDAFKYQAVLRNGSGEILANTTVALRISVLQDSDVGAVVYEEIFHPTSNAHGLVDIEVGGDPFHTIEWKAHLFWLKVEVDPDNGSSFTHLGTSQLLAVPYALNALTVELDAVDDADPDPDNELQTISLDGLNLSLSQGGGTVVLPSGGSADNWGSQVVESDATLSGDGTSGDPLGVLGDLTDDQTLSVVGNDLTISEGNTVALPSSPWSLGNPGELYYMGNIGLNIADPEQRLHVVGNTTMTGNLGLNVITPAQRLHVVGHSALIGNVGINTTSPSEQLHVNGIGRFDLNGGSINLSTPGGNPGIIAYTASNGNRRDIVFDIDGIGLLSSTSSSIPGTADGLWIVEGGNVGIQSWTPGDYPLLVNQRSSYGLAINNESDSELWELYVFPDGDLNLYRAGSVYRGSFDAASGTYSPVSDRRFKTDIQPMNGALNKLKKLNPATYKMKDFERERREIGLVAQELNRYFPELVFEKKDKSGGTIYTVNYNGIAVVAVKAIQEQQEIIEAQEETIEQLTKRIEDLERRFESLQRGVKRLR